MVDALGYVFLVLGGPFIIAVTVLALPLDARSRWIVASVLGAWFLFTLFNSVSRRRPGARRPAWYRDSDFGCRGPLSP